MEEQDNNKFSWSELGNNLEGVLNSGVNYVGGIFDANAANAGAIAAVNSAQAIAILEKAQREKELSKNIVKIVMLVVFVVAVLALFSLHKK